MGLVDDAIWEDKVRRLEPEVTRLTKIEEAARLVVMETDIGWDSDPEDVCAARYIQYNEATALVALAAALTTEPTPTEEDADGR